jgi:hypothetical protein
MSASIKSAQAPGVINAAIFGTAGTDEIDLELIEGSWQVPLWHNGKRLGEHPIYIHAQQYFRSIMLTLQSCPSQLLRKRPGC